MSMIHMAGYASRMYSLSSSSVATFADMGFTEDEIMGAESAHISCYNQNAWYWYSGRTPAVNDGHKMYQDGERIIRGTRNIRNFKVIAQSGTVLLAITLGTFGRAPIP